MYAWYTCAHVCIPVFTCVYLCFLVYKTENTVYVFAYLCIQVHAGAHPRILVNAIYSCIQNVDNHLYSFYACVYLYIPVKTCIRVYILEYSCVYVGFYLRILVHTCLNVYTHVDTRVSVCLPAYTCVYM